MNPATRTVTLMPGQRKQIALRMDDEISRASSRSRRSTRRRWRATALSSLKPTIRYDAYGRTRPKAERDIRRQGRAQGPAASDQEGHQRPDVRAGVPACASIAPAMIRRRWMQAWRRCSPPCRRTMCARMRPTPRSQGGDEGQAPLHRQGPCPIRRKREAPLGVTGKLQLPAHRDRREVLP